MHSRASDGRTAAGRQGKMDLSEPKNATPGSRPQADRPPTGEVQGLSGASYFGSALLVEFGHAPIMGTVLPLLCRSA